MNIAPATGLRVAVTGGTGFLGYHICDAFNRVGARLRVLARRRSDRSRLASFNVEFVDGDLSDAGALRALASGCSAFVHAGGLTQAPTAAAYAAVNSRGTSLAVAAAKASGVETFVLISSLAVAGPTPVGGGPLKEDAEPRPQSEYGKSKLEAENILRGEGEGLKRRIILRPGAVYGPYDKAFLVYFKMVARGIRPVLGDGSRIFQAVYGPDVAEAAVAALGGPSGEARPYFINPADTVTWEEFGRLIEQASGRKAFALRLPEFLAKPAPLSWIPPLKAAADRLKDLLHPRWEADPSRAGSELGWAPALDVREGIRRTRNWYLERGWL